MNNLILMTDSYKASHFLQYPPGTTRMYSYLESRGGHYSSTVFFGLQYILQQYLGKKITVEMVEEAKEFFEAHGEPFPYEDWLYIANDLQGKIPLRIRAVPEGTVVPVSNVLMDVESTDPRVYWVVSWFETLLMRVWYPITVATQSWHIKRIIHRYLSETADNADESINFKLHDFGARGVSSHESAALGGAAHLVNFKGSDTVEGIMLLRNHYGEKLAGFSIPAAEHSTITSWTREGEYQAYENMLNQFGKSGASFAVVSDSYDIDHAVIMIWGEALREKVITSGATVVIRPDSGDPVVVAVNTVKQLADKFGFTYNSKGYKVLQHVRVIQGDGVDEESIVAKLEQLTKSNFSADNIAFGMGGALLQKVNRDTQRFAYKCSEITVGGQTRPVFKSPKDDPTKVSKRGKLDLIDRGGKLKTVPYTGIGSALKPVYENGQLLTTQKLADIRKTANSSNWGRK
jgi:nicotinamide phosphoribosyltransferase